MKYLNQYRVRFWVSAFFQIALFAAAYLPSVTLIRIEENVVNVERVSQSALWYLSNAGFPEIYTAILTVYALLSLPVILFGFKRGLKPAPLLIAAVADILYLAVNVLLTLFILNLGLSGDFATSAKLTVWFWIYVGVQIAQIVHLFMLFNQIKKK